MYSSKALTFFMPIKNRTSKSGNSSKSQPIDPNFEDHAIGNTPIFFLALLIK